VVLFGKTDDGLFTVAPGKDACIIGQFDSGQFLGGGDKFQTARGYVKEWLGNRAFPQRHADTIQLATQFVVFTFDRCQIVDDIKEATCFAGIGVEVAAVLQIGRGEELQQVAGARRWVRTRLSILGWRSSFTPHPAYHGRPKVVSGLPHKSASKPICEVTQ